MRTKQMNPTLLLELAADKVRQLIYELQQAELHAAMRTSRGIEPAGHE